MITYEDEQMLLRISDHNKMVDDILSDYDRRRATPWGRFLLWLLRNTT